MQVSSYFTPSSNGERNYRIWPLWSKYIVSSKLKCWDFPGSPVVKILPSNAGGAGLIPGHGAKIPHASRPKNQNVRKKKEAMCLVAQSCLSLCDPMDCSPPGSSVHGDSPSKNTGVHCHDLQGIFPTQRSTQVSQIGGGFFTL